MGNFATHFNYNYSREAGETPPEGGYVPSRIPLLHSLIY